MGKQICGSAVSLRHGTVEGTASPPSAEPLVNFHMPVRDALYSTTSPLSVHKSSKADNGAAAA